MNTSSTLRTFSPGQMANFRKYVRVQKSNKFNMLTRQAQQAAGLDRDQMVFTIDNYASLQAYEAFLAEKAPA